MKKNIYILYKMKELFGPQGFMNSGQKGTHGLLIIILLYLIFFNNNNECE